MQLNSVTSGDTAIAYLPIVFILIYFSNVHYYSVQNFKKVVEFLTLKNILCCQVTVRVKSG